MKTLVVVAALAAVATAAPALYEDNNWGNVKSAIAYPQVFKRDRKSTQLEPKTGIVPTPGVPVVSTPTDLPAARHFALKKPIIVKKKAGYHVYRDSDEEQADSRETCVKQVKVKLCDTEHTVPKSSDMTRSSGLPEDHNTMMTEDEMKHSIKLAKEAVENIQRDLKNAEHKTGEKALKHDNSETDKELHHDIEVARQALEHIHQNFGNLESMSLHELKPEDLNAETKENHEFAVARTEEERLAQWKQAVENIHRNVEIARNIEDSFKLEDEQMTLPDVDVTHTEMRATEIDSEDDKLKNENHPKLEKSSDTEILKSAIHEDDMSTSAATLSETKAVNQINDLLKSASDNVDNKMIVNTKELARESEMESKAPLNHELQIEAIESKLKEESKERKSEDIKKVSMNEEPVMHKEEPKHEDETMFEHAKDAIDSIDTTMFVKSAEPTKIDKNTPMLTDESKNIHDELTPMKEKDVEDILPPFLGELTDHSDIEMKSAEPFKQFHEEEKKGHKEHHHDGHHHIHMPHHHEHMHHQTPMDHSQMRWDHESKNVQMAAMKAAEDIQLPVDHHHHLTEHALRNYFDAKNLALHQQHHMLPNTMMQGKSADMDNTMQSNFFMNMRDSNADNQRFRWRPVHESSRSAYGPAPATAAAASSGSAVGLFPNANVGSCGIPLLLSCNPSVVSGSLAKSHSYGAPAPAYRSEDDFNFHNKRDIKKTETITTLNRLPTHLNMKMASNLVAKH